MNTSGLSSACLHLEDGSKFDGKLIGSSLNTSGELVFTTAMVGYSESLTDPSYFGQILCFTYPLIGNYGIPEFEGSSNPLTNQGEEFDFKHLPLGFESDRIHAAGVVISTPSDYAYHWNSVRTLDNWLKQQNVPAIIGLDTRHLIHVIREKKGILGRLVAESASDFRTYQARGDNGSILNLRDFEFFNPHQQNLLPYISVGKSRVIGNGKYRIAMLDCGVKWNIIRQLLQLDCEVEILPWNTDVSQVSCDGWLISNGPGDPQKTEGLVSRVAELLKGDKPVLGICLGHQILALAAGAGAEKMQYGHRSHNQPVYVVGERRGFITSQNHGFKILDDLPSGWQVWFRNANDQSLEGIRHESKPFASVQFHPEAAGGPRDTAWIMNEFVDNVKKHK